MYHFIDNSIRGGIAMITTRYARANVPTVPEYDDSLPNQNLIYLDANNLYGWAMSQPLPTHGFHCAGRCTTASWRCWGWLYILSGSAIHTMYTILTTTTHSPTSRRRSVAIYIHQLSDQYFRIMHLKGSSLPI